MSDELNNLWLLQKEQQKELGLDPRELNDVEKARTATDILTQLYEEVGELGRASPEYKRHMLARSNPHKEVVSEEVADVLKCTIAIAQLHGLTIQDVVEAFVRKTAAISAKHATSKTRLTSETPLICVDLDDVLVDSKPWRDTLGNWTDSDAPAPEFLQHVEDLKNRFYAQGGFRDLLPMPEGPEVIRSLAKKAKIAIITARPQWQYKRLYADTVHWLKKHDVPYDILLFNKDKVEAIYEHITPAWPLFFIEDHERNAKALSAANVPVLLYSHPHNEHVSGDGIQRVDSWGEIHGLVSAEIRSWNQKHQK